MSHNRHKYSMKQLVVVCVVFALLFGGGCVGFFDDEPAPTPAPPTTEPPAGEPTPSVFSNDTAASVPAWTAPETLPAGFVDANEARLRATDGFVVQRQVRYEQNETAYATEVHKTRVNMTQQTAYGHQYQTQNGTETTSTLRYTTASTTHALATTGEQSLTAAEPPTAETVTTGHTPYTGSVTPVTTPSVFEFNTLDTVTANMSYVRTGTTTRGGESLTVYTLNASQSAVAAADTATVEYVTVSGTVLVDDNGIIRSFSTQVLAADQSNPDAITVIRKQETYEVTRVGAVSVAQPAWVPTESE